MRLPLSSIAIGIVTVVAIASCTEPVARNDVDFTFPDSITRASGIPPVALDPGAIPFATDTFAIGRVIGPSLFDENLPRTITAELIVVDSLDQVRVNAPIPLASCPFVLTVSRVGSSSAVWASDRVSSGQCPPLVDIGGGIAIGAKWPVASILGDSLPVGDYEASFDLHTASGRVMHYGPTRVYLFTETINISRDYTGLQWSASTTTNVDEREFITRVVIHNPTDRYIELQTGGCSMVIQLFKRPSVMPQPSWSSEFGQNGCDAVLRLGRVHPGDSSVFISRRSMEDVTEFRIPAGRYLVSARMPDLGLSGPAGWVDILPPTGLRSSGVFDSLTAAATTRVIPGNGDDTLRTLVLVTNRTNHRIVTSVPTKCPVGISAYRDADMRDVVRLEPAYTPGPLCYATSSSFALDPGQSWVFGRDTPMSLVRTRGGAGHYWFTATLLTRKLVYLTAGEADVR